MKKLRSRGLTYREIAEKIGISHATVVKHMMEERLEGTGESLEKLALKMVKWEPRIHKVVRNEASITSRGIDIFSWAAGHFKGYKRADMYVDERGRLLGIKPAADGQRTLSPNGKSAGFSVACAPILKQIGVRKGGRVPAEWSERKKMLLVDLRGARKQG